RWYLNPKYSDLKIICRGETLPAHRLVVCSNSSYFARLSEGLTQEIFLEDHGPFQLKMMLQYLYMEKYTPEPAMLAEIYGKENGDISLFEYRAAFHAQMYGVGDYFQIPGLKTAAQRYFTSAFSFLLNRDAFCTAVSEVYNSTLESDRGLRDIVV
ncbi:BTB/POZ domain-containing protein, partial [Aspergillus glaucus CBS 516.65]